MNKSFRIYAQKTLFSTIPPTDSTRFALLDGSNYLLKYANYLQKPLYDGSLEKDSTLSINGKYQKVFLSIRPILYIKNLHWQEILWTNQLASDIIVCPVLEEDQIDVFAAAYPNSKYIPHLRNLYKKAHADNVTLPSILQSSIIDSTGKFKALAEIIASHFKGKSVYVDIWATWCGPCKSEFKYNHFADSVINANGMERLYISIDAQKNKKEWLENIDKYKLGGSHILASNELVNDLLKKAPFTGIPHYIIINNKGEIVDADAMRPSSKRAFVKNIKEKISN